MFRTFNYWFIIMPLMSAGALIWDRLFLTSYVNKDGDFFLKQRVSDSVLHLFNTVYSIVTTVIFAYLLCTESWYGLMELYGRDMADREFGAIFIIIIVSVIYVILQFLLTAAGYDLYAKSLVGRHFHPGIVTVVPYSLYERFRRKVRQFFADARPVFTEHYIIDPRRLHAYYSAHKDELDGDHSVCGPLSDVASVHKVCEKEPFSNAQFLPQWLREYLGEYYFPEYRSYQAAIRRKEAAAKQRAAAPKPLALPEHSTISQQ